MSNSTEQQNIVGLPGRLKNKVSTSHKKVAGVIKKSTATLAEWLIRAYENENSAFHLVWWKFIPAVVSFCLVFAVVAGLTPITFAYEVLVDGKVIGYVSDESTFQNACDNVNSRLVEDTLVVNPNYTQKMVVSGDIDNVSSMCDNLISGHNFAEACGLYVNGKLAFSCPSRAKLIEAVEITIQSYYGYAGGKVVCSDKLEYVDGLFDTNSPYYMHNPDIAKLSSVLTICTVITETVTEDVPFKTVEVSDSSMPQGFETVSVKGQNGKNKVKYNVYYQNGVEVKRVAVSSEVISLPKDQKVVRGTRPLSAGPNGTNGGNAKYFWPVARVENSFITAYWGDGRNHKAIDICAPAGTPIYAGEAGTVTLVENLSYGYGKYLIIDHGNGYQTLYSHCSAIYVSNGQKVARGQNIAAIGMTGDATGNHLHFEVRINGTKVNPAPYLGV